MKSIYILINFHSVHCFKNFKRWDSPCISSCYYCNEIFCLHVRCWWLNETKYSVTCSLMFIWTMLRTYTQKNTTVNTITPHYKVVCSQLTSLSMTYSLDVLTRIALRVNAPLPNPSLSIYIEKTILSLRNRWFGARRLISFLDTRGTTRPLANCDWD
jgi:hypothetical protein